MEEVTLSQLVDKYDNFLFDCDGVLWNGSDIIEGANEGLMYLKSNGKQVILISNTTINDSKGMI